jgi:hypothetical protein
LKVTVIPDEKCPRLVVGSCQHAGRASRCSVSLEVEVDFYHEYYTKTTEGLVISKALVAALRPIQPFTTINEVDTWKVSIELEFQALQSNSNTNTNLVIL